MNQNELIKNTIQHLLMAQNLEDMKQNILSIKIWER